MKKLFVAALTACLALAAPRAAHAQSTVLTYQFVSNLAAGQSTAATNASWLEWAICAALTGNTSMGTTGSSGVWTMDGSSNGVTAGLSGADNVHCTSSGAYTSTDWVFVSSAIAHSWYSIASPFTDNGKQLHIIVDLDATAASGSIYYATITVGYGALSGGTTTAAPTLPANQFHTYSNIQISDNSGGAWNFNAALSAVGTFNITTAKSASSTLSFALAMFETANNVSYDPYHDVFFAGYATSLGPYFPGNFMQNIYGIQYDGTAMRQMITGMIAYYPYNIGSCNGASNAGYLTFCASGSASNMGIPTGYVNYGSIGQLTVVKETTPNADGNYNFWPVFVAALNVSGGGQLGPKGTLVDVNFVNSTIALGSLLPGSGTPNFAVAGTSLVASGSSGIFAGLVSVTIPCNTAFSW